MVNELSLFSGVGGGLLGTKHLLGFKTIGYVEWEPYCQEVIKARIADGYLDPAPIFGDIRRFISDGYAEAYQGMVDVIAAGFPCQPFSVAGKQQGENDPRNMWPATLECIRIIRPRFAFLENVPGLLADKYIQRIFGGLAEAGYDAKWIVLGADDLGAPHRRKRLWVLADSISNGSRSRRPECKGQQGRITLVGPGDVAHSPQRQDNGRERGNLADPESGREGINPAASERFERGKQCQDCGNEEGKQRETSSITGRGCTWWLIDPADLPDTELHGHDRENGNEAQQGGNEQEDGIFIGNSNDLENSKQYRLEEPGDGRIQGRPADSITDSGSRPAQPRLGRVAHGVAHRVDRLKAIGNGQVSRVAAEAWRILIND